MDFDQNFGTHCLYSTPTTKITVITVKTVDSFLSETGSNVFSQTFFLKGPWTVLELYQTRFPQKIDIFENYSNYRKNRSFLR